MTPVSISFRVACGLLSLLISFVGLTAQTNTGTRPPDVPGAESFGRPAHEVTFQPAYPPSPAIAGVTFDDRTARTEAEGSDIWPMTWADNDQLYTAWGDGGGFGGTNRLGRVKLGVARVEGGKRDYRGVNLAGGQDAPQPAPFDGKSEGILALGNTLYLWRDNDRAPGQPEYFISFELWRSDNLGSTWHPTGVKFVTRDGDYPPGDGGMFAPAFCQFGRGYAGARDDYLYIYAPDIIDPSHWRVRVPGRINLLRVPRAEIESKPAYEFYAGNGAGGEPRWTRDIGARRPVWRDERQGTHRIAVSYNPALKRYLLTTIAIDRSGWMSIYDAPEPWGPWTHVHTELNPDRWGTLTICFTFVNKWLSADGRDFVLVHTKNDRWATIEGRFELKPGAPPGQAAGMALSGDARALELADQARAANEAADVRQSPHAATSFPPYPPSPIIAGLALDWSTHERHAIGSDNWQTTWADDDHMYAAWGDGGGAGGSNRDGRVGLGYARIEGDWNGFRLHNVWGGREPENPAEFSGKSWGTIAVEGVLYSWVVPDNPDTGGPRDHYRYIQLARSTDHGRHWTRADWRWWREDNLIVPTFLVFGKNNAGARDGYVYSYFIRPQHPGVTQAEFKLAVHQPGAIFLARVARDEIFAGREAYRWFAGLDANARPRWGELAEKRPVFEAPAGTGWCLSASHNPGLGRYLLAVEHGATSSGTLGLFDAPEPWGPWTTVKYWTPDDRFGGNRPGSTLEWRDNVFFLSFAPKWLSADGRSFTLVFTGSGNGKDNDSFNAVRGKFLIHGRR